MQSINLSTNTITSYVCILISISILSKDEGGSITLPYYRTEETVKTLYTDKELTTLLKKNAAHADYLCSLHKNAVYVVDSDDCNMI